MKHASRETLLTISALLDRLREIPGEQTSLVNAIRQAVA